MNRTGQKTKPPRNTHGQNNATANNAWRKTKLPLTMPRQANILTMPRNTRFLAHHFVTTISFSFPALFTVFNYFTIFTIFSYQFYHFFTLRAHYLGLNISPNPKCDCVTGWLGNTEIDKKHNSGSKPTNYINIYTPGGKLETFVSLRPKNRCPILAGLLKFK